jgi:GNAT superfamily N-acetyltransferase
MAYSIREAEPGDVESIVAWTTDTFSWGDYIPEVLPTWLAEPESAVLVSVDDSDVPVAMCHVSLLSPTEGWLEGARVHPEQRRSGHGRALNHAGVEWAAARGARVMRLATDASNVAARNQVAGLGYREVSHWLFAEIDVDPAHRTQERYRMRPAPGSDTEAAWLFWVAGDLARQSRELIALGWRWRTARPSDLSAAAGDLIQSTAGWASVEQPAENWLRCNWMATTPDDILGLLDGLIGYAAERGVTELDLRLPDLPWTGEALRRVGADPGQVVVCSKPI